MTSAPLAARASAWAVGASGGGQPADPEALALALLTAAASALDPRPLLEAAAALLAGRLPGAGRVAGSA